MMRHVDLCSGIGGFALGFEWAGLSRPVMFCDIEPWSREILAKHWPDVPIVEDVKVLANEPEKIPAGGRDTILTAGYPCQPFSTSGKRLGTQDDRHIWPYIREIVAQKRPAWCVFENVYGHVSMGLDQVLSDLETDSYATRAFIVPACGVDAPHRRDRVWIIARDISYTKGLRFQGVEQTRCDAEGAGEGPQSEPARICGGEPTDADVGNAESIGRHGWAEETGREGQTHQPDEPRPEIRGKLGGSGEDVADTNSARCEEQWWGEPAQSQYQAARCGDWWVTEPPVGRLAHGIPNRVDQLKGLGNAIVPQIAMQIGIAIRQCEASATGQ